MLIGLLLNRSGIVQDLVGVEFNVAEQAYAIVDVRQVGAQMMVYASELGEVANPGRTAFRLEDIEPCLQPVKVNE